MAQQIIPLTGSPNQALTVTLSINGGTTSLQLYVSYNAMGAFWAMDVYDLYGNPIVLSVAFITGAYPAANILAPYQYLAIGSAYIINVNGTSLDFPNASDLGTDFILLWDDNVGYVPGTPFGGAVTGPAGPPGPQGPPGTVGGFYYMGSSGNLTPIPGNPQFTQVAGTSASSPALSGAATILPPSPIVPGAVFLVQLIQPSGGGITVAFNTYYKGLSGFALDTTGNTQAVFLFQNNALGTAATLMQPAINGQSIL